MSGESCLRESFSERSLRSDGVSSAEVKESVLRDLIVFQQLEVKLQSGNAEMFWAYGNTPKKIRFLLHPLINIIAAAVAVVKFFSVY